MPARTQPRTPSPFRDRRGAVAILMAIMLPVILGISALAIDLGIWFREQSRLQIAADAAAMGAARLLSSGTATSSQYAAAALLEAQAVSSNLWLGSLATPVTVSVTSSSQLTVTLNSTASLYLTAILSIPPPKLVARATAGLVPPPSCVLTLNPNAAPGIQVDNAGSITGSNCGIFTDSTAANAIYLNSGTISANAVGAVGSVTESNSGSNTLNPSPGTSHAAAVSNPYASLNAPTPGACNYTNASFTAYQSNPYQFTQSNNVFCGNTTIGGNSSTDTFAPGIYYVVNGNLTFNNATITQASGVTFVITGSSPGAFIWTNNSNTTTTISAPATGPTAGIVIWQTCPSSGAAPANSLAGGSTLQLSGEIYTPCGALNLSNNAKIIAASGAALGVVAAQLYATGSASLAATAGGATASSTQVNLLQ